MRSLQSITVLAATVMTLTHAMPAHAWDPAKIREDALRRGKPVPTFKEVARSARADNGAIALAASGAPLTVYLNRHGGSYQCGDDDSLRNKSSVPCPQNADVGAFPGTNAQWTEVKTCLQDQFSRFNLIVTDVEPTSGDFVEAVIGGSPDQANMPWGVGGVAPFSCDVIPSAVIYAFADVYQGPASFARDVCETSAQEIAHAFGLDHEYLCEDPMTYLSGCGEKDFKDIDASCGEYEPRECSCGGTTQNSVDMMFDRIGPSDGTVVPPPPDDQAPPTATIVSPSNGAILAANSTVTIEADIGDDIGLALVELEWDYSGETMYCPSSDGSYSCTRSDTHATWQVSVGEGSRTFRVHVRDVVGNEVVSDDVTVWMSADGEGPPDDTEAPKIVIATPLEGAEFAANGPIEVVAIIGDDSGVARGALEWSYSGDTIPCPYDDGQGVISCAVAGDVYRWSLQVGTGDRSFRVRATDVVGNESASPLTTITLNANPKQVKDDDLEGNDTPDTPAELSCGDDVELVADDVDWFTIDAKKGERVSVSIDGDAKGSASVLATQGASAGDVLDDGGSDVAFDQADGVVVGVIPDHADAGSYRIRVSCASAAAPESCQGCTGTPAAPFVGLIALALIRRRRRC